ncbi:MAG: hypothetical protein KME42_23850 [Tildeniella nuda ZEHNDER 1965/U140]|jgi:hypothetical protein|nr:hypothetical protein [Tildeniella nuda ZEHNDER 1965/U140]
MVKQDISIQLLPGMLQIVGEHQCAGQQPDNLCGPYWAALLLRSRGFHHLTSEYMAQLAGSVLPTGDPITWLPQGAASKQDYELPLPTALRPEDAGTSAQGLMTAVAMSEHSHTLLPLQTEWSAEKVAAVLELCQKHPAWNAVPLCNVRTGHLWGSHLSVKDAIAYLKGGSISPPPADWNVGHFMALAGTVAGQTRSLVIVCDTYPMFGWQGYHLQSADAIAQALNRDDGYGGGILLFIATHDREQIEQHAQAAGFHIEAWDNGSP